MTKNNSELYVQERSVTQLSKYIFVQFVFLKHIMTLDSILEQARLQREVVESLQEQVSYLQTEANRLKSHIEDAVNVSSLPLSPSLNNSPQSPLSNVRTTFNVPNT